MKHKHTRTEIDAIKADLRSILPPGSTVYTILRHVSRSGMQRRISLLAVVNGTISQLDGLAKDALGWRTHKEGGIVANGCGMDMGFDLVYRLGRALYQTAGGADAGYTFNHRWL